MSYIRNIEPILISENIGISKAHGSLLSHAAVTERRKRLKTMVLPLISASGQTLLVFQTPGMQERKKEMSWMHVLSVLWGAGNLFNG